MCDEIAGLKTCFVGRGAIDRRDDFDPAVFLSYFDA
jgi:hypothetical protein